MTAYLLHFETGALKLPIQWCSDVTFPSSSLYVNNDVNQTPSVVKLSDDKGDNKERIIYAEMGDGVLSVRATLDTVITTTPSIVYSLAERPFVRLGDEHVFIFTNLVGNLQLYNVTAKAVPSLVLAVDTDVRCNGKSALVLVEDTPTIRAGGRYKFGSIHIENAYVAAWKIILIVVGVIAAIALFAGLFYFFIYKYEPTNLKVLTDTNNAKTRLEVELQISKNPRPPAAKFTNKLPLPAAKPPPPPGPPPARKIPRPSPPARPQGPPPPPPELNQGPPRGPPPAPGLNRGLPRGPPPPAGLNRGSPSPAGPAGP